MNNPPQITDYVRLDWLEDLTPDVASNIAIRGARSHDIRGVIDYNISKQHRLRKLEKNRMAEAKIKQEIENLKFKRSFEIRSILPKIVVKV